MKRKLLALVLVMTLVLSLLPMTAAHAEGMTLFVKPEAGRQFTVELEPTARIEDLKQAIQTAKGYPPASQILVFAGRQLEDGNTLQDYNIQADSIIRLKLNAEASGIEDGAILHCFDWSYNEIKANLKDIADAGYVAVQTSPVQQPKDYNAQYTSTAGEWWKLYQPLGLRIAPDNDGVATSWLGTKDELAALCAAADEYGIKVIVDIVSNHLANYNQSGGTIANLSPDVDPQWKDERYFHSYADFINDSSRFTITQYQMGMPDLNTANDDVQEAVLELLIDCVDCGVDGFRFDAAKHIELPTDTDANCASDYWPTVVNGIKDYCVRNGKPAPFIYGEILGGAGTNIANYTAYMSVTDNETGNAAREAARRGNAAALANYYYYKGASADKCVLWAESHDTYLDGSTNGISDDVIEKTWAIVGARADSAALFFARPNEQMGAASTDTSWKDPAVAEVNLFKTHFSGTGEYLSSQGKVAYVERGATGVVIVNLNGEGNVSVPAHLMTDGVYQDHVTADNAFTVENGVISGYVGASGVAVVYNEEDPVTAYIPNTTLYFEPQGWWLDAGAVFEMQVTDGTDYSGWIPMTQVETSGKYAADVPAGTWTQVEFCRKDPNGDTRWNYTGMMTPPSGTNCCTQNGNDAPVWSRFVWTPVGYYLVGNMTGWEVDPAYMLEKNPEAENEYWIQNVKMTTSREFKVVKSTGEGLVWYPDLAPNCTVSENGTYTIYFNPDGNSDWAYTYLYAEKTAGETEDKGYYLVGSMTDWQIDPTYKLTRNEGATSVEEYEIVLDLTKADQFKIVYSVDGEDRTEWFPDPGSNYGLNGEILANGCHRVYFRPNRDGGNDWFYNCIYAAQKSTVPLASGYYLIKPDWTVYTLTAADLFAENPEAEGEYMLKTTLLKDDQIKVVRVENDMIAQWYPDGLGNQYTVDEDHASDVTIYFRPAGNESWAAFGGYIWIEVIYYNVTIDATAEGIVTADPTSAKAGAPVALTVAEDAHFCKLQISYQNGEETVVDTLTAGENGYGFTMPSADVTVAAVAHVLTEHPAVAATCTEDGNIAYWSCDVCGKYFADAQGTTEIAENSWVIAAIGHDWQAPTYTWLNVNRQVLAKRVCANDAEHEETETVNTQYAVVTAPTLFTEGLGRFTAEFTNPVFVTQTKDFIIPCEQLTLTGGEVLSTDVYVKEDGQALYRYDIRIGNLPEDGLDMVGAQLFITYDSEMMTYAKASGPVEWQINEEDNTLRAVWASDTAKIVHNGDAVLSLYFTRKVNDGAAEIAFTVNTLGNGSMVAVLTDDGIVDLEADTTDGCIVFEPIAYGDANCDGMITAADAALILRSVVQLSSLTPGGELNGDVNGDGEVTASDAALILRFIVGKIDALPVEP